MVIARAKRNLELMRRWYRFWQNDPVIAKQLVSQIPWGHNLLIVTRSQDMDEAIFYVQKTIKNGWSRSVLSHHIKTRFYVREGKAITIFELRLPAPQSDLAQQLLKDPYNFDFLMLRKEHDEKELEDALVAHMTRFCWRWGQGFRIWVGNIAWWCLGMNFLSICCSIMCGCTATWWLS
jgi:predicted nuclease of restriction endonuclease-like (RecB) superfamily